MPKGTPNVPIKRVNHASLSRPEALFHDHLPRGAEIVRQRTPWQRICDLLIKAWGDGRWLGLEQVYTNTSTALSSARKTFEAGEYPTAAAEAVEIASLPFSETHVRVFLRLDPHEAPGRVTPRGATDPDDTGDDFYENGDDDGA